MEGRSLPLDGNRRKGVHVRFFVITLLAALVLQGCAAGQSPAATSVQSSEAPAETSAESTAGATSTPSGPLAPLKVAVGSPSVFYGQAYLAQSLGYFDELGLEVEIVVAGSNQLTMLVAEQVDLMMAGMGGALLPVEEGKDTKVIYGFLGNGGAGMLVGTEGITDPSELTRVGTLQVGGSPYGYASFYKDSLGLDYEIVNFADNGLVNAALSSGSVDGAVSSYQALLPLIDEGTIDILIDPRDPDVRAEIIGADIPEAGVAGLAETLEAKRASVVQFIKAFGMVRDFYESSTPAEIAAALHESPDLQTNTVEQLEAQYNASEASLVPAEGYITESDWEAALNIYGYWGLDADLTQPEFEYSDRVDMSFYEEGIGEPSR
jgi:NitT/TauT family transport system substrate-binding protein